MCLLCCLFWSIPICTQDLFLSLFSEITSGRAFGGGSIEGARNEARSAACKASFLPNVISPASPPLQLSFIFLVLDHTLWCSNLFLAVHLGITPGRALGILWDGGIKTVRCMRGKRLTHYCLICSFVFNAF